MADLVETILDAGTCSGREVDKFAKFNLAALPAPRVAAPLAGECMTRASGAAWRGKLEPYIRSVD